MMKSPLMKTLMDAAILLTAVCSIHVGLIPFGYNALAPEGMLGGVADFARYLFGAAGVYTLVMFFMGCGCGHEGSCNCK